MDSATQSKAVQATYPSDEIGIREITKEFRVWVSIIRTHFIWVIILFFLGGTIGFIYAYLSKPEYIAKTRFMLKNEGVGSLFGGQMSSLTGLLGGGQMGTPLERTAEVIASDRIIGRVLLQNTIIGDSADLVINHFIKISNLRKIWSKDKELKKVIFSINDNEIDKLSLAQRKALKYVKNLMVPEKKTGIVRKLFDKKSGVLTVTCVYENEDFAIGLSRAIYDELSRFFVEQMTYTSANNAEVMKRKLDSIQRQLNSVRRTYAQQMDQSLGLLLQQDKVELKSLSVKEQILTVAYAEAMKNYESFQFMNSAAMPSLTLIDFSYAPIKPSKKSQSIYALLFSIVFVFCFVFLKRVTSI
jgi:uncharacterized protein involved in exopolysaccharide biosynthesis